MAQLRVLLAAAEVAPLVSVGGLAEYVLGLGSALRRRGHDVRVAVPAYGYLRARQDLKTVCDRLVVSLGVGASEVCAVRETWATGPGADAVRLPVYALGEHKHFASVQHPGQVYAAWPNHEPWVAFSRAVIDFLNVSDFRPDVIHCQDAHTAVIPVYIQELRRQNAGHWAWNVRTVLTIHNLLNQGKGDPALLAYAGLPPWLFTVDCFEYYGRANCLKAGLVNADAANTVSRTYAKEICTTPEFGFGLEGVLRSLAEKGRLRGIVNGIDEDRWHVPDAASPGADAAAAVEKTKGACRRAFFKEWGWKEPDKPTFGFRGRWDMQKGIALLVDRMDEILEMGQFVFVTWGTCGPPRESQPLWEALETWAKKSSDRFVLNPKGMISPEETGHQYALCDFLVVPSLYEPCGLVQMECQRYGTIPIVRRTGGLADTVAEDGPKPNGFVFEAFDADEMLAAMRRALDAWRSRPKRRALIRNALGQQNGWQTRVPEYEALYGARG